MIMEPLTPGALKLTSDPRWPRVYCRVCYRFGDELLRKTESGKVHGEMHVHHCHFGDAVYEMAREAVRKRVKAETSDLRLTRYMGAIRFDQDEICGDCNNADVLAKRAALAGPAFSFSPSELSAIVRPVPKGVPMIDQDAAASIYQAARPFLIRVWTEVKAVCWATEEGQFIKGNTPFERYMLQMIRRANLTLDERKR